MTSQRFLARISSVLFPLAMFASSAAAQAPPAAPKPGPEHAQLKYFVGKWTTEGELKENPFMPAGKFRSDDNCELFSGGFYVVCNSSGINPAGPAHSLGILGYNMMKKVYTYYGIDNHMPMASSAEGKYEGDTWVYTETMDDGSGKKMQGRYTISNMTPKSYSMKYELAPEGSTDWKLVMEAKATKGAARAKAPADTTKDTAAKPSEGAKKPADAAKDTAKKPSESPKKP